MPLSLTEIAAKMLRSKATSLRDFSRWTESEVNAGLSHLALTPGAAQCPLTESHILAYAARSRYYSSVRLLLNARVWPNLDDLYDSGFDQVKLFTILEETGVFQPLATATDRMREMFPAALKSAAALGLTDIVQWLIARGVHTFSHDRFPTALILAASKGGKVEILRAVTAALHAASPTRPLARLFELRELSHDGLDRTPFSEAAFAGCPDAVRYILSHGSPHTPYSLSYIERVLRQIPLRPSPLRADVAREILSAPLPPGFVRSLLAPSSSLSAPAMALALAHAPRSVPALGAPLGPAPALTATRSSISVSNSSSNSSSSSSGGSRAQDADELFLAACDAGDAPLLAVLLEFCGNVAAPKAAHVLVRWLDAHRALSHSMLHSTMYSAPQLTFGGGRERGAFSAYPPFSSFSAYATVTVPADGTAAVYGGNVVETLLSFAATTSVSQLAYDAAARERVWRLFHAAAAAAAAAAAVAATAAAPGAAVQRQPDPAAGAAAGAAAAGAGACPAAAAAASERRITANWLLERLAPCLRLHSDALAGLLLTLLLSGASTGCGGNGAAAVAAAPVVTVDLRVPAWRAALETLCLRYPVPAAPSRPHTRARAWSAQRPSISLITATLTHLSEPRGVDCVQLSPMPFLSIFPPAEDLREDDGTCTVCRGPTIACLPHCAGLRWGADVTDAQFLARILAGATEESLKTPCDEDSLYYSAGSTSSGGSGSGGDLTLCTRLLCAAAERLKPNVLCVLLRAGADPGAAAVPALYASAAHAAALSLPANPHAFLNASDAAATAISAAAATPGRVAPAASTLPVAPVESEAQWRFAHVRAAVCCRILQHATGPDGWRVLLARTPHDRMSPLQSAAATANAPLLRLLLEEPCAADALQPWRPPYGGKTAALDLSAREPTHGRGHNLLSLLACARMPPGGCDDGLVTDAFNAVAAPLSRQLGTRVDGAAAYAALVNDAWDALWEQFDTVQHGWALAALLLREGSDDYVAAFHESVLFFLVRRLKTTPDAAERLRSVVAAVRDSERLRAENQIAWLEQQEIQRSRSGSRLWTRITKFI